MNRRRSIAWMLGACCLSVSMAPMAARAATDNKALYAAATRYRNAVLNFERVLLDVRGIDRSDERLVDKFEEATKKMRLAARNPRHSTRLRTQWRDIQPMQLEVEATIFNKYTPRHDLIRAWEVVLYAHAIFKEEYSFHLEYPKHGNSARRRIVSSQPNRYLPPPPASSGSLYSPPRR